MCGFFVFCCFLPALRKLRISDVQMKNQIILFRAITNMQIFSHLHTGIFAHQ